MELTFWGVRGTIPVSGRDINKYGGQTPCASLVSSKGEIIIIDAGTGIRKLGTTLIREINNRPLQIHILLTHFHIDHIMGFPFFAPLYFPESIITFYAPVSPEDIQIYLSGLMAGRYFPLEFRDTKSKKKFVKIPEESFTIGGVQVSNCPLSHPQGSVAYNFQENEINVIFATDTEHPEQGIDERLASFVSGAYFLIYDGTFTPEEYKSGKQGWGHSTWLEGTKIAKETKTTKLFISHFNPDHPDSQIDKIISLAQKEFPQTEGAREGLKVVF
ncbi:MAG: MBL fold metallo-hydrolase [Candidatus Aminicenantaceae bacterium]